MQAVILCAGASSRFYPLQSFIHKANFPLLGKPLFIHTLESIKKAGITDVVIVIGENNFIQKAVGNGEKIGLSLTYVIQAAPRGMGEALLTAKEYLQDSFFLTHGHHIDFHEHSEALLSKQGSENGVVLLAKVEQDVSEFGVLEVDGDKVTGITEKPKKVEGKSRLRLIGLYLLNKDFLSILEQEKEDHYSFESALNTYAGEKAVRYATTTRPVISLKYPWNLLEINSLLLASEGERRSKNIEVGENVTIEGKVIIEDGVRIESGAVIKGPIFIGKNAYIGNNSIIRSNTSIGEGVSIGAHMEVKNSILSQGTTTHAGFIGDSIIGPKNKIATFFITANVRLDRKSIKVTTDKGEIDTKRQQLGVVTGQGVKMGIRVSTMPGVIIGENALIGPGTTVAKNIPQNTKYYTKFQEIIESGKKNELQDEANLSNKIVLLDIDYTLFNTAVFKESELEKYELYEEVIDMLVAVSKKATLGIFSEGELDFQSTKLQRTDIYKHFLEENIHIVNKKDEKLKEVLQAYRKSQIIIVDDKLTVLHLAKEHNPGIVTIWVKRGIYAENQKEIPGFKSDIIVDDLREIAKIIDEIGQESI